MTYATSNRFAFNPFLRGIFTLLALALALVALALCAGFLLLAGKPIAAATSFAVVWAMFFLVWIIAKLFNDFNRLANEAAPVVNEAQAVVAADAAERTGKLPAETALNWDDYQAENDAYWTAFDAVCRSPLAREIYFWLPRLGSGPKTITWQELLTQFGACYSSQFGPCGPTFITAFTREFQKVTAIHAINVEVIECVGLVKTAGQPYFVAYESTGLPTGAVAINACESTALPSGAVKTAPEISLVQEPFESPEDRARECMAACAGISLEQLRKMNAIAHGSLSHAYDACDEIYAVMGTALERGEAIDGSKAAETFTYIARDMRAAVAWARLDATLEPLS